MTTDMSLEKLAVTVGLPSDELAAFDLLDNEQIAHLVTALEEAQLRQSTALENAITQALSHVPALLRKPILKILGR